MVLLVSTTEQNSLFHMGIQYGTIYNVTRCLQEGCIHISTNKHSDSLSILLTIQGLSLADFFLTI